MANTAPPTQPAGAAAGMNGKGMSHCKERGEHRERPRDRRPDDDIGGVCRVTHGEIGEPTLLAMQAATMRKHPPPDLVINRVAGPP